MVLTIAALKPSSSPLGDPPLHVSSAAMSELSPIASGQILHLKWTLQVDSSPQKELYDLNSKEFNLNEEEGISNRVNKIWWIKL